jgi:glycosyltransferase involved in cell wall biosynthesis
MRVLVLAGNIDRPEAAILEGLAQRGVGVHLVGEPSTEFAEALERAGVTVTRFAFHSRFDIRGMSLVRSLVRREKIDVVYAVSNRALSSAVIGLSGIAVPIAAYRGTVGHISSLDPTSWFTYLNPKVRKIFCVSKAVEEYLAGVGISRSKLTTIYKGHRPEWYRSTFRPDRGEFGIPADAFVVGCTAAMRAVKGIDDLLEAVKLLLESIPSLHLLLVGPVKDSDIERHIARFPDPKRIHLTGFRSDATALAPLFDVTVMASKSREGFPKSVIEAMAQGIPAIVTSVGGMPELVNHGAAGLMVEPCNPGSIASAIERLYREPELRRKLGVAAKERISSAFHVHETIEQVHRQFMDLSKQRSMQTASGV